MITLGEINADAQKFDPTDVNSISWKTTAFDYHTATFGLTAAGAKLSGCDAKMEIGASIAVAIIIFIFVAIGFPAVVFPWTYRIARRFTVIFIFRLILWYLVRILVSVQSTFEGPTHAPFHPRYTKVSSCVLPD